MIAIFFIGLIALICGLIAVGVGLKNIETGVTVGGVISAIIGIVFLVISFIRTVPTGSTGIITTFGKVENYTLDAGVTFMAPWKSVICMDNRTQKESLNMNCFSSDIQEVSVTYTINYQINKENAQDIYRQIGKEYFTTIVQPKAYEAVKGVFAKYDASNLISSRSNLSQEIEDILVEQLSNYNIIITSTSIEDIDFTDAFTNAVEAAQVATQNKIKAQTEQEQAIIEAEAAAERKKIEANAEAEAAIISAEADAKIAAISADSAEYQGQKDAAIMSNLGKMLSTYPQLIDYYRVTNWDGKMPETMLGDTNALIGVN